MIIKTIKCLKENLGANLCGLGSGDGFSDTKNMINKRKNVYTELNQNETMICFKGYHQDSEKETPQIGENI